MSYKISILGIRGIPARYGGFETFAEHLACFLAYKGWEVTVYCQEDSGNSIWESTWQGIRRVHVPVSVSGSLGTIVFDGKAVFHALSQEGIFLTLGYNTAIFSALHRLKGQANIFNMDGVEWRRAKWGVLAKTWLRINERIACWVGNHLIADHPEIKKHLLPQVDSEKITMIPYGGQKIVSADADLLKPYGVTSNHFSLVVARPEPENSLLEIVQAFSARHRNHFLVVLGNFLPDDNKYHNEVMSAASDEVLFLGGIYDADIVSCLRFHSRFYVHGHQVGGTNPSLVEALGAGCAVLAHDNVYTRWVAGSAAMYFEGATSLADLFDNLLSANDKILEMKTASRGRFDQQFTWPKVLDSYHELLLRHYPT